MTLTPLDQHDPRLRQTCAILTKAQLRDRQQQLEINALLDFVYGMVNKDLPACDGTQACPQLSALPAIKQEL